MRLEDPLKRHSVCLLFAVLLAGQPFSAAAADNQLITSVAAIYEYNDNIRLNADDALSDSIYTVAPKIELVREAERLTVRADGMAEFYDYQDYDQFDDTDQWYNAAVDYRPTERWQLGIEGHASVDNRPDRDIAETGLVLSNIQRKRFEGSAAAEYAFSEITSGGLLVAFNRENFDNPETSDRKDYHAVLSLNRNLETWLTRTSGRIQMGYSHYAFARDFDRQTNAGPVTITDSVDQTNAVDDYSLSAGTESALSERFTLTVDAGGRYSHSQNDTTLIRTVEPPLPGLSPRSTRQDDSYDSWGFVGSLGIDYRGERTTCGLFLSHDLQPVSGENGTANRTSVRLRGTVRLLEKLRGHLAVQWYQNVSDTNDTTQEEIDTQTWNARGGLQWLLSDTFSLDGEYAYTIYEDRNSGTTAYRNKVLVQLIASHDWLE